MKCQKCGCTVPEGSAFCPFCGTSLVSTSASETMSAPVQNPRISQKKKSKKDWKKYIGVLMAISVVGWGYFHFIDKPNKNSPVPAAQTDVQSSKDPLAQFGANKKTENMEQTVDDKVKEAEVELDQHGLLGSVIATSYGHSDAGFLALVKTKDGSQTELLAWDRNHERVSMVRSFHPGDINKFVIKGGNGGPNSIILYIAIPNDTHDQDASAGDWQENVHIIPVYASYKLLGSGNIEPGRLTTGKGLQPSHFQQYLYEQKNVDMVNLILTEMPSLRRDAFDKKVDLSNL